MTAHEPFDADDEPTSPPTSLEVRRAATPVVITSDQIAVIKNTLCKDATPAEMELFFYDNKRRGVHPLDRLIHFTKRNGKYTPVTSIDFFRSRAGDTGEHVGTDEAIFEYGINPDVPIMATVRVYRWKQGQKCAYAGQARMREYMPQPGSDFMWRKMPCVMLAKCAEAQALRKAFPQELQGLYTVEEMAQADSEDARPPAKRPKAVEAGPVITKAQQTRFFAIAKGAGWTDIDLKTWLEQAHGLTSSKDIPKDKYDEICATVEKGRPAKVVRDLEVDEVF